MVAITPLSSTHQFPSANTAHQIQEQANRIGSGNTDRLGDLTNRGRTNDTHTPNEDRTGEEKIGLSPRKSITTTYYGPDGKPVVVSVDPVTGRTTPIQPTKAQMAAREAAYRGQNTLSLKLTFSQRTADPIRAA